MTRLREPSPDEEKAYKKWLRSRPANVRKVAERFDPWTLYRLKSTGNRVTIYSFGEGEDGTVTLTVNVTGHFNLTVFDRRVFGINPDDLEPCDPPSAEEAVGTLLTQDKEINAYLAARGKVEGGEP